MGSLLIFVGLVFVAGMSVGAVLVFGKKLSAAKARQPSRDGWRFCVLGAIVCLVISIASTAYTTYFLSASEATTATVIRIEERKDEDNETVRSPVYAYFVDEIRHVDRPTGSDGRQFSVGDEIPIRYLRDRPHESRIDYWAHHWGVPVFMLGAAIVCAGVAVVIRMRMGDKGLDRGGTEIEAVT
jgi:hypothetical protein